MREGLPVPVPVFPQGSGCCRSHGWCRGSSHERLSQVELLFVKSKLGVGVCMRDRLMDILLFVFRSRQPQLRPLWHKCLILRSGSRGCRCHGRGCHCPGGGLSTMRMCLLRAWGVLLPSVPCLFPCKTFLFVLQLP